MPVKKIIRFAEKHADYAYDISTEEQYNKVALAVLRRRDEEGHWYFNPEGYTPYISEEHKELVAISDEVAVTLPEVFQKEIKKAKKAVARAASEKKQMQAWWDLLRETLALPDEEALVKKHRWTIQLSTGPKEKERSMVQMLLESRIDAQYEGFEIIELDELD